LDSNNAGEGVSTVSNLKIPRAKVKIKIEKIIPKLFLDIKVKNKKRAKEIIQNTITRYKFIKTKERTKIPKIKLKQIV